MRCSKNNSKRKVYSYKCKGEKWSQINYLLSHLKELQKEQNKPEVIRKEVVIKIRAELNKIETWKTMEKVIETKNWLLKMINKIGKPSAKLIKKREGSNK